MRDYSEEEHQKADTRGKIVDDLFEQYPDIHIGIVPTRTPGTTKEGEPFCKGSYVKHNDNFYAVSLEWATQLDHYLSRIGRKPYPSYVSNDFIWFTLLGQLGKILNKIDNKEYSTKLDEEGEGWLRAKKIDPGILGYPDTLDHVLDCLLKAGEER